MLYYVQSGDINTSSVASTPRQAALDAMRRSSRYGECIVVSEEEIGDDQSDSYIYFLTESLMEEHLGMRLVD